MKKLQVPLGEKKNLDSKTAEFFETPQLAF
jgi:hypothetical protein